MVSLEEKIDINTLAESDENLRSVVDLLEGKKVRLSDPSSSDVRKELLLAISDNNKAAFLKIGNRIANRLASTEADWCHDDFLIFLLILGNQKYGRPLDYIEGIIELRRNNTNPLPQKINEIFSALYRQDFAISGELGFLKIPFLYLIGSAHIDTSEARNAYKSLSKPGLLYELSPFFKVLTIKAYEFVLFERTKFDIETTSQLVSLVRKEANNLNLKNAWDIILSIPLKLLVPTIIFVIFISVSLYTAIIWITNSYNQYIASIHNDIEISSVDQNITALPLSTEKIAGKILDDPNNSVIIVKSNIIKSDKKNFVVEISHNNKVFKDVFSFVQYKNKGIRPFTVVPIQKDGVKYRAFVPDVYSGAQLVFIVSLKKIPEKNKEQVVNGFILRVE